MHAGGKEARLRLAPPRFPLQFYTTSSGGTGTVIAPLEAVAASQASFTCIWIESVTAAAQQNVRDREFHCVAVQKVGGIMIAGWGYVAPIVEAQLCARVDGLFGVPHNVGCTGCLRVPRVPGHHAMRTTRLARDECPWLR